MWSSFFLVLPSVDSIIMEEQSFHAAHSQPLISKAPWFLTIQFLHSIKKINIFYYCFYLWFYLFNIVEVYVLIVTQMELLW